MDIQATLNRILEMQYKLQNEIAAMFLLMVVFMSGVVMYLREFKDRHTIQNLAKSGFQMVVKLAKAKHKTYKNLGDAKTKPDALPLAEKIIAESWLEIKPRQMSFSESFWLPIVREKSLTRDDFKAVMNRWRVERIVKQKSPTAKTGKGTALIAARDEQALESRFRLISGKVEG